MGDAGISYSLLVTLQIRANSKIDFSWNPHIICVFVDLLLYDGPDFKKNHLFPLQVMVFKESSNGDLDQLMAYWGDRCQQKSDVAFVYDVLMTGRIIQQLADIYCTNVFNKGVCFYFPGIKCCPGEKNTPIL